MAEEKNAQSSARRAGALKSSLSIELHSDYAIRLWAGRQEEKRTKGERAGRSAIASMPQVIHAAGRVYQDSAADNPYADAMMVQLEQALTQASAQIQVKVSELEAVLSAIPSQISLTTIASVNPLNIGVFSRSPLGYRCVWLLVGYDQLAMKAFQAHHYGLISRQRRDGLLNQGGHLVRRIYGILRSWPRVDVTRADILNQTPRGVDAVSRLGIPDEAIMSGAVRSSFSPPLRRVIPADAVPAVAETEAKPPVAQGNDPAESSDPDA
jgi:integrating conjugative element protein (TIGR03761 family)